MTWTRWSLAWERALYGPGGFYRTQRPGRHFATSVTGVPGTIDVLADALVQFLRTHHLRTFVDLGAGRSDLACAMATRVPDLFAVAIDIRPAAIPSTTSAPPAPMDSVKWVRVEAGPAGMRRIRETLAGLADPFVFAHEWLDVVPCEIAEVGMDDILRYVLYDARTAGERLGEPIVGADLAWCRRHWPMAELAIGDRVEIGLARDRRWAQVTESMRSGMAIAVDFGHLGGDRPRNGTLTGYRNGRAVPAVADGSCDLTAAVAMDSLGAPLLLDQRAALTGLGVTTQPPDPASAAADPHAYLSALARSAAAAALLGPGYGDTLWAIGPGGVRWSTAPDVEHTADTVGAADHQAPRTGTGPARR